MQRSTKLIRPPQEGDVWYVRLHGDGCTVRVDTVEVLEKTEFTVLLRIAKSIDSEEFVARFELASLRWIEFVRSVPRAVASPTIPAKPVPIGGSSHA